MPGTTLLLVDVQNDFHPGGTLAIPSAGEDALRIAEFLRSNARRIDRVVATMDSHHRHHVAHACFWVDADGNHPGEFSTISAEDAKSGRWRPRDDLAVGDEAFGSGGMVDPEIFGGSAFGEDGALELRKYCEEYTEALREKGRFQLTIWPEHCLLGSPGHNVVDCVRSAVDEWIEISSGRVEWMQKGQNLLTEMYSAFSAEVPVTRATSFNVAAFESLVTSDRLVVAGQALSHCVNYTVRDLLTRWPAGKEICLLEDCCSAVPGFEEEAARFVEDARGLGVRVCSSTEVFA